MKDLPLVVACTYRQSFQQQQQRSFCDDSKCIIRMNERRLYGTVRLVFRFKNSIVDANQTCGDFLQVSENQKQLQRCVLPVE